MLSYLEQRCRDGVERPTHLHHRVMGRQCLKLVGCSRKRKPCVLSHLGRHGLCKPRLGVEPSAHCGAALGKGIQAGERLVDGVDAVADLSGVAPKLLTQREGGGVLRVGAADLDNVGKFFGLGVQCLLGMYRKGREDSSVSLLHAAMPQHISATDLSITTIVKLHMIVNPTKPRT